MASVTECTWDGVLVTVKNGEDQVVEVPSDADMVSAFSPSDNVFVRVAPGASGAGAGRGHRLTALTWKHGIPVIARNGQVRIVNNSGVGVQVEVIPDRWGPRVRK